MSRATCGASAIGPPKVPCAPADAVWSRKPNRLLAQGYRMWLSPVVSTKARRAARRDLLSTIGR